VVDHLAGLLPVLVAVRPADGQAGAAESNAAGCFPSPAGDETTALQMVLLLLQHPSMRLLLRVRQLLLGKMLIPNRRCSL